MAQPPDDPGSSTPLDASLAELVEEFASRLQRGEAVHPEEFVREHPEFAEELRQLLPAAAALARLDQSAAEERISPPPTPILGPHQGAFNDFRLVREIGRGGMGIVYEAVQVSLCRRVALKMLPDAAAFDPRRLQRFQLEAQAAARLAHSNIVPVFFVGFECGIHFYAMQLIDGQPLSALIAQLRGLEKKMPMVEEDERTAVYPSPRGDADPTPPAAEITPWSSEGPRDRDYFRKVAELGVQAAEALDHAHQLGVVHRDIKPANLMLDYRGNLWVTDFGLAHISHVEAGLTATGQALGTPRYMSPEQASAQREPIDHRTDIYSLGATLYELLTLRPAFAGQNPQELLQQILTEDPLPPRRLDRSIPLDLETIVLKAMEKRPQDRYSTAQELADDLERWLKNEPIRARRPTFLQRASKWVRRHKPVFTAGVIVLLMAVGMAGYFAWARHERTVRRAERENVIVAALEEAYSWQTQRRLPEALSAARRADGLLAGTDVDQALQQRVRARLADLELLDKLENVLLEKLTTATNDDHFDGKGADALLGQTFREAGLDVEALPAEEAGERIRRSTVAAELAAVLDGWARIRWEVRGIDDPGWKALLRVAQEADPEPWRRQVRQALAVRDRKALREAAAAEETLRLPAATLSVLGAVLREDKESLGQAERLLREAQRRHPNDFWANEDLFWFFSVVQPCPGEEAIRFAAVAVGLRPESPGARMNFGNALSAKGRLSEAIAEYREAIRLKNDSPLAHDNLARALMDKGCLEEALSECREAIRLNKDLPWPHNRLGNALLRQGRRDEAIAEYREAIRLKKDFAEPHRNLGVILHHKGQVDDAIREYREAIHLRNDDAKPHYNLGNALHEKGKLDEAIAEYREALRIDKSLAQAHTNLGNVLRDKGRLDEAIAEYRASLRLNPAEAVTHHNLGSALAVRGRLDEAIAEFRQALQLQKDYADAHYHLGLALMQNGQPQEAVDELRRGHEIGSSRPHWRYPSAKWLQDAERLAALDARLPALLKGKEQAKDGSECLALARLCQRPRKKLYVASARWYAEAFTTQPALAEKLASGNRYDAACAAALVSGGFGADAAELGENERARWRRQALDWLRADLDAWRCLQAKSSEQVRRSILQRLQHWQNDPDLESVRRNEALDKLPKTERAEWQRLWQEVEMLRQQITSHSRMQTLCPLGRLRIFAVGLHGKLI